MNDLKSDSSSATQSLQAPINLLEVIARFGGDKHFAAEVLAQFKTQAVDETDRLMEALKAGERDSVRRTAHNLKSMSAYMSARLATEISQQIEWLARDNRLLDAAPIAAKLREEIQRVVNWIISNDANFAALCE